MATKTYPARLRPDWPRETWERDRRDGSDTAVAFKRPEHDYDLSTVVQLNNADLELVRHDIEKGTIQLVQLNKRGDRARAIGREHLPPKHVVEADESDFEPLEAPKPVEGEPKADDKPAGDKPKK